VTVPPRIAQKPMGMSKRDMGRPERAEMRATTGRKSAAAPTFCINEEIKAAKAEVAFEEHRAKGTGPREERERLNLLL